jgi:hypothetical protein
VDADDTSGRVVRAVGAIALVVALPTGASAQKQQRPSVHFDVRSTCPSHVQLVAAFGERVQASAPEAGVWSVEVEGRSRWRVEAQTERRWCCAARKAMSRASARSAAATAPRWPRRSPSSCSLTSSSSGWCPIVAGGVELGIAPAAAAPAAQLGLALGPPSGGWLARLDAQVAAKVSQESATDRIERFTSGARLELGGRFRLAGSTWLAGSAGGGVALARVTALDLEGEPATLRLWPALSASLVLGLELGAAFSACWSTGARFYPRTERYRVEPEGVVASSPKGDVISTVGLQFDAPL